MSDLILPETVQYETAALPYAFDRHSGEASLPSHRHEDYEILFVKRASFRFWVNDREIHLRRNQALLIDRFANHGLIEHKAEPDAEFVRFVFAKDFLFPSAASCISTNFYRDFDPRSFTLTQVIGGDKRWHHEIITHLSELELLSANPQANALSIQIRLLSIFDRLQKERARYPIENTPVIRSDFMKAALIYIHENYTQKLLIGNIAASLHVSTNHFIKTFRSVMGMTPKQYVISLRIKEAMSMMQDASGEELAVSDIAIKVGFDDVNYFSRIFKKEIGMSPTQFMMDAKRRGMLTI